MSKLRGFESVKPEHRRIKYSTPTPTALTPVTITEGESSQVFYLPAIVLPTRADPRSAGYDFYAVSDITLLPAQKQIVSTDVKAYMQEDEVLEVYIRSSLGIKNGIMLCNSVGVIDSSYYSNEANDGNIGVALVNTTGTTVTIKAGERFAQGIFQKYLLTDDDVVLNDTRTGGTGSSGK